MPKGEHGKPLQTTLNFYAGLEATAAVNRYNNVLLARADKKARG